MLRKKRVQLFNYLISNFTSLALQRIRGNRSKSSNDESLRTEAST